MILTIPLNPYSFQLVVIIKEKDKAVKKFLKKATTSSDKEDIFSRLEWRSNTVTAFYTCSPNNESFVRLREKPTTPKWIAIMVHECSHPVMETMRRIGMPLTVESEEAYTYLLDYIVRNILEQFIK